jgi:hypothetical protein
LEEQPYQTFFAFLVLAGSVASCAATGIGAITFAPVAIHLCSAVGVGVGVGMVSLGLHSHANYGKQLIENQQQRRLEDLRAIRDRELDDVRKHSVTGNEEMRKEMESFNEDCKTLLSKRRSRTTFTGILLLNRIPSRRKELGLLPLMM